MTMTDTEAKALALVNEHPGCEIRKTRPGGSMLVPFKVLCRAIEREAATEARHAAELREQAERFSEAVDAYGRLWSKRTPSRDEYNTHFAPFILPAPDPLVVVIAAALREASPFADDGHDYTAEAKVAAAAVRAQQKDTNA